VNFKRVQNAYQEFPGTFWTLVGATFIDRLGGALLFPFFALYVTHKFGVGMTQVGILFTIFAATSFVGSMLGGALTDKFGRRGVIIFGLVTSALSSLCMGLVNDLNLFYILAAFVGLLADTGGPAQQAMVADLLPKEKHAQGYGILRVAFNLAVTIGPAIGGLLATQSYLFLFIADAISSAITAVVVYFALPESKPQQAEGEPEQSLWQAFGGYNKVLRDGMYMAFLVVSMLAVVVYVQMNSTLSVYLRDVHGVPAQGYGYILSLNAAMVVLLQFWITRRVTPHPPMLMMALGTAFYAVGFAMYGFVSTFVLFMAAMVVITIGEMVVVPVAQALVANFAPDDMRGRYMAMFGFSWTIPFAVGPLLAGLVMDNYNPNWVWYASGILCSMAILGYLMLHTRIRKRLSKPEEETPPQPIAIAESNV
jgi:MFS family permease